MDYSLDIRAWSAGIGAIVGGFVGDYDRLAAFHNGYAGVCCT